MSRYKRWYSSDHRSEAMSSKVSIWMGDRCKNWLNLSFTKTPRVVYIRRELTPEPTGAAI
jgi:hypothetical protein